MDQLFDRALFFTLGCLVGLFFSQIVSLLRDIKEKITEVDEIVKHDHDHEHNEQGFIKITFNGIAMLIVVSLAFYAAVTSQGNSNALENQVRSDIVSRCKSGVDNRNVQRATVEAVYNLATGAAQRTKSSPELTPEQVKQYNLYIQRVNDFRVQMYKKIKPSEQCMPYVDDDNVKPPSGPFPTLPVPKGQP